MDTAVVVTTDVPGTSKAAAGSLGADPTTHRGAGPGKGDGPDHCPEWSE